MPQQEILIGDVDALRVPRGHGAQFNRLGHIREGALTADALDVAAARGDVFWLAGSYGVPAERAVCDASALHHGRFDPRADKTTAIARLADRGWSRWLAETGRMAEFARFWCNAAPSIAELDAVDDQEKSRRIGMYLFIRIADPVGDAKFFSRPPLDPLSRSWVRLEKYETALRAHQREGAFE